MNDESSTVNTNYCGDIRILKAAIPGASDAIVGSHHIANTFHACFVSHGDESVIGKDAFSVLLIIAADQFILKDYIKR